MNPARDFIDSFTIDPMDRTNRVFGRTSSFEEAYPDLQDVIVNYKQYMMGSPAGSGKDVPEYHSIRNHGGVIRCNNALCNKGGFEVDRHISEATTEESELKLMSCSGHEKMGRGQTRSCGSWIRYKIRTVPKESKG